MTDITVTDEYEYFCQVQKILELNCAFDIAAKSNCVIVKYKPHTKNPYASCATRTSSAEVVIAKLKQELQTINKLCI